MHKVLPAIFFLFFISEQTNAQLGTMKLVGKGTKDYQLGFGAFIKAAFPVADGGSYITAEIGADIFFIKDEPGDGTVMCPLKVGYRYTLNGSGKGLYVEPQVGFNLYGVTSLLDENGQTINLKYHGVVLAAGTGYVFDVWNTSFDINLRYETIMAHGGSNNFISLGISKYFSFGRRDY